MEAPTSTHISVQKTSGKRTRMEENLKTWLVDLIKWILIIIIAAVAFYIVCPKYYFDHGGFVRCNKVTGKVEFLRGGNWTIKGQN